MFWDLWIVYKNIAVLRNGAQIQVFGYTFFSRFRSRITPTRFGKAIRPLNMSETVHTDSIVNTAPEAAAAE